MQAALAGWVSGYAVSIVFTLMLVSVLLDARRSSALIQRLVPSSVGRLSLSGALLIGGMLGWTLVGLVLGGVYSATREGREEGLGSPFALFTMAAAGGAVAMSLAAFVALRRWQVLPVGLTAAGVFGWLLPHLAERQL